MVLMKTKKQTRAEQREILRRAQRASAAGDHDLARELFASQGISYAPAREWLA